VTFTEHLTWTCYVCHETRPDAEIAVLTYTPGAGRRLRQNVRYCRDRVACVEGAKGLFWSAQGLRPLDAAIVIAFPDEEVQRSLLGMVPEHLHNGIARYVSEGRPTGDFLRAVLENDLAAAAQRADMINRPRLVEIALFVTWHVPSTCWGSPEIVRAWVDSHAAARATTENG
jgi:hypothetical protein